jgi:DNA-directed RNA polymerase specialized sigma24 family protein
VVEPVESQREAVYEKLRARVLSAALRRGIPANDAEDFAHDVLEKTLREVLRPGAPTLEIRAFAAMRDKSAEYWRRAERRPQLVALTLPLDEQGVEEERPEMAVSDDAFAIIELRHVISAIAGEDAMRFALLKIWGGTEADIAVLLGWSPQRAAAARVQLGRKKGEIARAALDLYHAKNDEEEP